MASTLLVGGLAAGAVAGAPPAAAGGGVAPISVGGPRATFNISQSGGTDAVAFQGVVGQVLTVEVVPTTFPDPCGLTVRVLDPAGAVLATDACAGDGAVLGIGVDVSGLHRVESQGNAGGATGRLRVRVIAPGGGGPWSITPLAPAVPLHLAGGTTRVFGFDVARRDSFSARATGTYTGACDARLRLLDRAGAPIVAGPGTCVGNGGFVEPATATSAGVYGLEVTTAPGTTGTLRIEVFAFRDAKSSITADGTVRPVTIRYPGQRAVLSFSAPAGRRASVVVRDATLTGCPSADVRLLRPDGSVREVARVCGRDAFLDTVDLDVAGTWQVLVDPEGPATGTANVRVSSFDDATGTVTPGGPLLFTGIAHPGQRIVLDVPVQAEHLTALALNGIAIADCPLVRLADAEGTTLAEHEVCASTLFIDPLPTESDGTWSLTIDADGPATGPVGVQALDVTEQHDTIPTNGEYRTSILTEPGQRSVFSFDGTAGTRHSVTLEASTAPGCPATRIRLVRPDGSERSGVNVCGSTGFLEPVELDVTGTWAVVIDPVGTNTGTARVRLWTVEDDSGSLSYGGSAPIDLSVPGRRGSYRFSGGLGDVVESSVIGSTFDACPAGTLSLVRPDGSEASSSTLCAVGTVGTTLDAGGNWLVVVDLHGANTGVATLTLDKVG